MWLLIFPVLSVLLFCAHLMFHGLTDFIWGAASLLLFMLVPKRWTANLVMVCHVLMGFEWIRSGCVLVNDRMQSGQSWYLAAAIMFGVALFTWASASVFVFGERIRNRYSK